MVRLSSSLTNDVADPPAAAVADAGMLMAPGLSSSRDNSHVLSLRYEAASRAVFVFLLVASALAFLVSFGFEHKNVKTVEREQSDVSKIGVQFADDM
jgi:hypothetical protein